MKEGPEHSRPGPRSIDEPLKHLKDLRGAAPHLVSDATSALREFVRLQQEDNAERANARQKLKTAFSALGISLGDDEPREE